MSTMTVESNAVPFTVRIVRKGEAYGLNFCIKHEQDKPIVEFYDGRHKDLERFTEFGQFVSRYYADTLLDRAHGGLNLCGGVPVWQIDSAGMAVVRRWLTDELQLTH